MEEEEDDRVLQQAVTRWMTRLMKSPGSGKETHIREF